MDDASHAEGPEPTGPSLGTTEVQVTLTPDELELVRSALEYLRQTLGREEAEQLDAVQRSLARLSPTR